ncbi:hypothetical protein ES703_111157 [subsurface metagenome]
MPPCHSIVEVVSTQHSYINVSTSGMNNQKTGLEQMKYYRDNSVIKHGAKPRDVGIEFNGQIVVGKFVDIERSPIPNLQDRDNGKST